MSDYTLAAHRRFFRNEQAILRDANLSAEMKLIAIIMRRAIDFSEKVPPAAAVAETVFSAAGQNAGWAFQRVMTQDIRRYDPMNHHRATCPVMLPRAKRPCGRGGSGIGGYITDLETGEKTYAVWCSKHVSIGVAELALNRAALKERIIPRPYANTGGFLRVHLPELDWHEYWRKLDNKWEPFPEREPVTEAPTLKLISLETEEAPAMSARASHPARGRRLRLVTDE